MKGEMRQIQLESGSTVFSEASTAVGSGVCGTFAKTSARHCCSFSEKDGIQRLDHRLHMKQFTGTGNNN